MKWLVLVILLASSVARAENQGARFLKERISVDWLAAAGGWRTSLGADLRAPGLEMLGGGTELLIGLDVAGPLGIVLDGRFLGGLSRPGSDANSAGVKYLEGLAALGLQLRVSEMVRLRAGGAAGELFIGNDTAILAGGWLSASIDLFAIGGHASVALGARLDVDALLAAPETLPSSSLALVVGLGMRY